MSDTIGIMKDGKIVQFGSPEELYDAPVNRYVADFVGESNFFEGEVVEAAGDGVVIRTGNGLTLQARLSRLGEKLTVGRRGAVAVRPEVIGIWRAATAPGDDAQGAGHSATGQVLNRIYLGDHTEFSVRAEGLGDLLVRVPKAAGAAADIGPGEQVRLGWRRDQALALTTG
jgi:spermidine/putrescine transport system ATP-binding protein